MVLSIKMIHIFNTVHCIGTKRSNKISIDVTLWPWSIIELCCQLCVFCISLKPVDDAFMFIQYKTQVTLIITSDLVGIGPR